jgi:biotin carboxyl carrier protein
MIKNLRVTVDGHAYEVTVELLDEAAAPLSAPAPMARAAAPPPPPAPAAAPVAAPAAKKAVPAGPAVAGNVPSPLAGRVTAIIAIVGQEVKEGEHLLTLEAMKMNTFVFAPKAGKVTALIAAVGDAVEEGQALMTIQ